MDALKKRPEVAKVSYISKEDALLELKQTLRDSAHLLEGLDENPLAPSIELKLRKEFVTPSTTSRISEELLKIPGIDTIYYGERIAEAIHLLKQSVQNISIIIFLTISLGVIFVTYSTVKILFYRKKEEIEILKLLGATGGFIRMPFLIEGGIIGLLWNPGHNWGLCLLFCRNLPVEHGHPHVKNPAFPGWCTYRSSLHRYYTWCNRFSHCHWANKALINAQCPM